MNKSKLTSLAGLVFALIGIAILLYTVFDDQKTSTEVRSIGFVLLASGAILTYYSKRTKD